MIGKVLAGLILVVLSFFVGAGGAENVKDSLGGISLIVGGFVLLCMGPRSWMLIFLIAPFWPLLPNRITEKIEGEYLIGAVILAYWLLMRIMGYVKFIWRSMPVLDFLMLLFLSLVIATYIRRPVGIEFIGFETEYMGASPVIIAVASCVFYFVISVIPFSYTQMQKVLRISMYFVIAVSVVLCAKLLIQGGGQWGAGQYDSLSHNLQEGRNVVFADVSKNIMLFIYAGVPLLRILTSPILLGVMVCCLVGLCLSGLRSYLITTALPMLCMSFVKREAVVVACLVVTAYIGVMSLSATRVVEEFPFAIQRIMSMIPGVHVSASAARHAQGTIDWRKDLWSMALDSRSGYIKDYVWGDGYGNEKKAVRTYERSVMRGETPYQSMDYFASNGLWHLGYLHFLHRVGLVGLGLITILFLYLFVEFFRVGMLLRGSPFMFPYLFFVSEVVLYAPSLCFLSLSDLYFFRSFASIAYMKLIYCMAKEHGYLASHGRDRKYVPMMIKTHQAVLSSADMPASAQLRAHI